MADGLAGSMDSKGRFQVLQTAPGTFARTGELLTGHGTVSTPLFMPVGTQATVKTLTPDEVTELGYEMILANAYHLYLRPGAERISELGGLHRFMRWPQAILTDSGGFQVFSLAGLRKVTEEGVRFRSHIDGSEHFLTPELAVSVQEKIGADIIMALDVCSGHDDSHDKIMQNMQMTHRWAVRCLTAHEVETQMLFPIVQGGIFPDLRQESAKFIGGLDAPGYAIGGLSVGEPKQAMWDMVDITVDILGRQKPRYLMGVGSPEDLINGIHRGIDMFDCALPTRVARNGALFTRFGRINVFNARFATLDDPVETGCDCYFCRNFTAAYLHHLFLAGEVLALRLATMHNLRFLARLVSGAREAIIEGNFTRYRDEFLAAYQAVDEDTRLSQKKKWLLTRKGK
ncbi:tRNA guanosine(34) transglycosylase Tgt [Chloroflexota bacterium]